MDEDDDLVLVYARKNGLNQEKTVQTAYSVRLGDSEIALMLLNAY